MPLCQGPCQVDIDIDIDIVNPILMLHALIKWCFSKVAQHLAPEIFRLHSGIEALRHIQIGSQSSLTYVVRHCNSSACAACVAYLSDISCTRSVRPGWSSTELLEFLKVSFISSFVRSISHCPMTILWIWKIFLPDAGPGPSCLDNGLPCQSPRGAQVDWALRIHRWGDLHLE